MDVERTSHKGIGAQPRDAIGGFVRKNGCIGTIGGVVAKVCQESAMMNLYQRLYYVVFFSERYYALFPNHEDYDYVESKWFGIKFVVKKS